MRQTVGRATLPLALRGSYAKGFAPSPGMNWVKKIKPGIYIFAFHEV